MFKILSAAAVLVTAMASAPISAQNERSSPVPRYHLMQLSVSAASTSPAEFETKTAAVQSCRDAIDLAKSLDADVKRNRFVRASSLPGELQEILADLPTGHATPVFSADGKAMRVLVLCYRV
ncbi:hypothetical protein [Erythrobacter sp. MTPC3]|uniref:hypothetical protein n=1 Tax=Erythrobacter sp. MTPC3 TaxID=3056564 RepID=UPI0036F1F670